MNKMIQVEKQLFYNNNQGIFMLYYTIVALQTEVTLYSQFTIYYCYNSFITMIIKFGWGGHGGADCVFAS